MIICLSVFTIVPIKKNVQFPGKPEGWIHWTSGTIVLLGVGEL